MERAERLEALLRELGPRLRRGGAPGEAPGRLPMGLPEIDRLLGGGLPRGRLSEVAGPASSGRTSLALALLAHATRAGEVLAVVDGADAFDPTSAESAGVRLERVLWVRAPQPREALRCTTRLLETPGFAAVLLDGPSREIPATTWPRLARRAAATGTALLLLPDARVAGTAAEVALEMRSARARFGGTPLLLDGLEIEAELVRHRCVPTRRSARSRLCA